mmetsp:Transcript_12480/g.27807  ORF Transcript_12480/g.27807 Transcript_12480/m.27807 type:complete len:853 (-) Transcript_12480:88-2646(-)
MARHSNRHNDKHKAHGRRDDKGSSRRRKKTQGRGEKDGSDYGSSDGDSYDYSSASSRSRGPGKQRVPHRKHKIGQKDKTRARKEQRGSERKRRGNTAASRSRSGDRKRQKREKEDKPGRQKRPTEALEERKVDRDSSQKPPQKRGVEELGSQIGVRDDHSEAKQLLMPKPPDDDPPPPPPENDGAPRLPADDPPPPPPTQAEAMVPLQPDDTAPPRPPKDMSPPPQSNSASLEDRPRRRSGWDERPDGTVATTVVQGMLPSDVGRPLPPAPPAPPPPGTTPQQGMALHTIDIEQKYVGYVVGKNGENIRYMEQTTGATVKLDHQNQQVSGYSVCRVYGAPQAAQTAFDLVRVRLASIKGGVEVPEGYISTELELDHKLVRHILGKSGETVRQLQQQSGANITLDSDRSERVAKEGYPIDLLRLVGKPEAVELAKQLIQQRVDESLTSTFGPEVSAGGDQLVREMVVEPRFVGVILGKGKEAIKLHADQFRVNIVVKQGLSEQEMTSIRITGDGADAAYNAILRRLDENKAQVPAPGQPCVQGFGAPPGKGGCLQHQWKQGDWICGECGDIQFARNTHCRRCGAPRTGEGFQEGGNGCAPMQGMPPQFPTRGKGGFLTRDTDDAFPIQQRFVGMLMGPGGANLKHIKETTGAKVFIDQDTRHQGYSMVRIGDVGSPQHQHARDMIQAKLEESGAFNMGQPPAFGPPGGKPMPSMKGCPGKQFASEPWQTPNKGGWNDYSMGCMAGGCEQNFGPTGDGFASFCPGGPGQGSGGYSQGCFAEQGCGGGQGFGPTGDGYASFCQGGKGNAGYSEGCFTDQGCGGGAWSPDFGGYNACPETQTAESWMGPQQCQLQW